jgi:hypothetical protein
MPDRTSRSSPAVFMVTFGGGYASFRRVEERTFYGRKLVRTAPRAPGDTGFSAVAEGDKCRVEWLDSSAPSILPGGARTALLENGAELTDGRVRFLVYVERADARWDEPIDSSPSEDARRLLARLAALPGADVDQAGRRFLELPYVVRWWTQEFARSTGFVQCRDGRVAKATRCDVVVGDQSVQLAWDATVFNLFDKTWVPGREHASFARLVGGADLSVLWECASTLKGIPVATRGG